jgi:hypothetical protein
MFRRCLLTGALVLSATALGACGGGTHSKPEPTQDPAKVLAKVGGVPITFGQIAHQMVVMSATGGPVPDSPSFAICVARSKAAASGAKKPQSQIKEACERRYRVLLRSALTALIHNQWIMGEARAEGVKVPISAVEQEFELSRKSNFKTNDEFAAYLKKTRRTRADALSELWVGKLTDGIFANIYKHYRTASEAEVVAYFQRHKQQFETPPGRDVHIIRTTSRVAALQAKTELKAGKSFAAIAKRLSAVAQPVRAEHGLTKNLLPHFYTEAPLNDAIFSAKPGVVSGPVFVSKPKVLAAEPASGYFVFEVIRTTPAHRASLAHVRAEIASAITAHNKEKVLARSIAAIRAKWKQLTDCTPGYVVPSCRQAPRLPPTQDPFQL